MRLQTANIIEASKVVNPIFLNSPQFYAERLNEKYRFQLTVKVESLNPIRSFKGRGTDYFFATLPPDVQELVCASAGNFGQGMAYSARAKGKKQTVFAARNASPVKLDSMRAFGAQVILVGDDFDDARRAAAVYAKERGLPFIEDGKNPAISEGAGTIALELLAKGSFDTVLIPVGNGALINGMGTYIKHFAPRTKIVGVVAAGAPSMYLSWKEGKVVETPSVMTIADGIGIRSPIAEAFEDMRQVVDEMVLVTDEEIVHAIEVYLFELGLLAEPAGAVGLAALLKEPQKYGRETLATVLSGANVTKQQLFLFNK